MPFRIRLKVITNIGVQLVTNGHPLSTRLDELHFNTIKSYHMNCAAAVDIIRISSLVDGTS